MYATDSSAETVGITPQQLLIFATGADQKPPLGFPKQPTINFNHNSFPVGVRKYPTANTCGLVLNLSILASYDEFKYLMEEGIRNAPTFGLH